MESGEDAGPGNAPGCLWWAETPRQQAIGKICGEEEPLLLHTPPSQWLVCSWWSNLLLTRSFRWAAEASNRDLCRVPKQIVYSDISLRSMSFDIMVFPFWTGQPPLMLYSTAFCPLQCYGQGAAPHPNPELFWKSTFFLHPDIFALV